MKAILCRGSSGPSLSEIPLPEARESEALIAVEACGLCGSDLLKFDSGGIIGHELVGRVAHLGSPDLSRFKIGDRVVVAHHVPCLDCHYCRRGSPSMCRQFKSTNIEPGGFSEFVRVGEAHLKHTVLKVPEDLDPLSASLTEPLACVLRNVKRLRLSPGDSAGIIGLGSIGLLTGQLLGRLKIAALGLDLDPARRALAERLGIPTADGVRARKTAAEMTDGRGLDALIFTAGTAKLVSERLSLVRDGGVVSLFASFADGKASLDLNELYHRELTLAASYSPALEDLRESLQLIASGAIDVGHLTERVFSLEEFPEAVRRVKSRDILKAIITPSKKKENAFAPLAGRSVEDGK